MKPNCYNSFVTSHIYVPDYTRDFVVLIVYKLSCYLWARRNSINMFTINYFNKFLKVINIFLFDWYFKKMKLALPKVLADGCLYTSWYLQFTLTPEWVLIPSLLSNAKTTMVDMLYFQLQRTLYLHTFLIKISLICSQPLLEHQHSPFHGKGQHFSTCPMTTTHTTPFTTWIIIVHFAR